MKKVFYKKVENFFATQKDCVVTIQFWIIIENKSSVIMAAPSATGGGVLNVL
ncbi:hypothetical protein [Fulvivirga sp. M361]|uniref:hypothetical protein n=1 Tax=Fulvivirga sp. M361 TaxID=2594266 RepID=UPI0016280DBE|nr:hypothetical protein [Fulvivirga sp. M361]